MAMTAENTATPISTLKSYTLGLKGLKNDGAFIILVMGLAVASYLLAPYPHIAMWLGFLIAAYSAIANDSIQTLGTFINSNPKAPWWLLWIFVASIFVLTVGHSFFVYSGDVSYQRLAAKGFETAPQSFSALQVGAPVVLLILTRLKIPVSTTFLLLSCFATSSDGVWSVVTKSMGGYLLAFGLALLAWMFITKILARYQDDIAHPAWRIAQWASTGFLWSVWLMQDAANIAVYLPRNLSGTQFAMFTVFIVGLLALLMKRRGGHIQEVVKEKSDMVNVRSATLIDLVYAFILLYFKMHSNIPMSTTWVFIGLLAGRELGRAIAQKQWSQSSFKEIGRLAGRDLSKVSLGLLISGLVAMYANEVFRNDVLSLFSKL